MPETSGKSKTPPKWDGKKDGRDLPGALTYPNYTSTRTRSGHTFILDDSDGAETVTLQHRSGSMVQFLPDGAVQFVSHNGQYTFVFGENRVVITGANDVTIKGDCSMLIEGDYNSTVWGNHNTTVHGDMNITARNMNTVVRGNMDASAKNMTTKIEGSTQISTEGVTTIDSDGGLSMSSSSAPVSILGQGDVGIGTTGKLYLHSGGQTNILSEDEIRMSSSGRLSIKSGALMGIDGGNEVWINSGKSVEASEMQVEIPTPTNPNFGGPK